MSTGIDGFSPTFCRTRLPGSPFLLIAGDINDDGTIVGQAFHPDTQASPAFMATPRSEQESEEPGNVQEIQTP
jgi:hypothetical protein